MALVDTMVRLSVRLLPLWIAMLLPLLAGGCASSGAIAEQSDAVLLVSGAGNDGPWYDGLRQGLADGGAAAPVRTFSWGAPPPLYMVNLQDRGIHEAAEQRLAERIAQWRKAFPAGHLALVGHSAGCGVILGAMGRLPDGVAADRVILLAPSVSPGYDLAPALAHITHRLDVFHSDRDNLWLSWRTGTFGTYDNVRTPAAGHTGFTSVGQLPAELRSKVLQHAYDPAWLALGNDGDHYGPVAHDFAKEVLAPLLLR